MSIDVPAKCLVKVELVDVLQAWIEDFLSKLPMSDMIEELTIDPNTEKPIATWNLGNENEPSLHTGSIDVSCKEVVMYSMISNLLGICHMPNSDKKFMSELSLGDSGES